MKCGRLSKWAEVRAGRNFDPPAPFLSSFIHSVTEVLAPAQLFLFSIPFFFTFFILPPSVSLSPSPAPRSTPAVTVATTQSQK